MLKRKVNKSKNGVKTVTRTTKSKTVVKNKFKDEFGRKRKLKTTYKNSGDLLSVGHDKVTKQVFKAKGGGKKKEKDNIV